MGVPYAEVIGDPVARSKSPAIHKFWLRKLGLEGDYRAVQVTAEELPDYLELRRRDPDWRGCSVTMPHKERILPLLDSAAPEAKRIGAVNTVCKEGGRLHGANTDVPGIRRSLAGISLEGKRVVLIGAGGAARAAAYAVGASVPAELVLVNRSRSRAEKLLSDLQLRGRIVAPPVIPDADLVINTVPPIEGWDLTALGRGAVLFEMIYDPPETPLVAAARRQGMAVIDGLTMLRCQAEEAFPLFFGCAPPRGRDSELRELLTS